MRNILYDFLTDLRDRQRITNALARGHVSRELRKLDLRRPATWEFSGFSQNGEDGILEVLRSQLLSGERTFMEIGSANGTQNNTSWLLVVERYLGLMVEGSKSLSRSCHRLLQEYSIGCAFETCMVTRDNAADLLRLGPGLTPDVFSLDIDGVDLHIARALFDSGLRPKIAVVEYNSVFGPKRCVTIPYAATFNYRAAHPTQLYYGVSISAWTRFFEARGYRFVTVDSHGVNAFFVDPSQIEAKFLANVEPITFRENRYQVAKTGCRGEDQFALIAGCALEEVA